MSMNFSGAPTHQPGGNDLLPKGLLAFAVLAIRPHNLDHGMIEKPSKSSDGAYLDVELTIMSGQHPNPFEKRKVWDKIGVKGSEKYIQAGHAAIRHILEVGKQASPQNMAGYEIPDYMALDGLVVAIKIGIEKGNAQYPEDKNNVRYLSPNVESDTHKDFARLVAGDMLPKASDAAPAAAKPATSANAWGAPAAKPATAAPVAAAAAQATGAGPSKPTWLR